MKGRIAAGVLFLVVLVITASPAFGDLTGRWGGGLFGDLRIPVLGFRQSYTDTYKFGISLNYVMGPRRIAEIEYQYSRWSSGEIEKKTFQKDGENIVSPGAKSTLRIHGLLANFLFGIRQEEFGGKGGRPYVMFGTGFYEYVPEVSGLRYPPDPTTELPATQDKRRALAVTTGLGVLIGLGPKAALDLRARYNFVLGELRPYFLWGIDKAYPFHLIDIGAGLKFFL